MGGSDRVQPCKFFLRFLTFSTPDEIKEQLETLKDASEQIEYEIITLCYYMNGVTYNEAWGMSPTQRTNILEFVADIKKKEAAALSGKEQM